MQLEQIREKNCITCGALAVSEHKTNKHCSGKWNEEREFSCGRTVRFSPNFNRVEVLKVCPKDPLEVERLRIEQDAVTRLINYINKLKVPDNFKKELLDEVPWRYRDMFSDQF